MALQTDDPVQGLYEALGIDPHGVVEVTITVRLDDAVRVTVTRWVEATGWRKLLAWLTGNKAHEETQTFPLEIPSP